jgi:DNA ligase-1
MSACNYLQEVLSVSRERAEALLSEAGGDMGCAVDLYYRKSSRKKKTQATLDHFQRRPVGISDGVASRKRPRTSSPPSSPPISPVSHGTCNCSEIYTRLGSEWSEYKPASHACWVNSESAPFHHLSRALELVSSTTKRLEKERILVNAFRSLLCLSSKEDVLFAVMLCGNSIASGFESVDLGVGGGILSQSILDATGVKREELRRQYRSTGDLGDAAQACRARQSLLFIPPILRLEEVVRTITGLSSLKGTGSESRKRSEIARLIRSCREGGEIKFLVRTIVQNIRTGFTLKSVLGAIAVASVIHHESGSTNGKDGAYPCSGLIPAQVKEAKEAISQVYASFPKLDCIIFALFAGGISEMTRCCGLQCATPVVPMLAKACSSASAVVESLCTGNCESILLEYKYDGVRCQVHVSEKKEVNIFSRNLENITSKYPDIAQHVLAAHKGDGALIIDSELVAMSEDGKRLLPFQELSASRCVAVFAFDLLLDESGPLLSADLGERRRRLQELLPVIQPGRFDFATSVSLSLVPKEKDVLENAITAFVAKSVQDGAEGLVCKRLGPESVYEPGKRSSGWVKLKKDYMEGHGSFDLVPIGAWRGNGRKAKWLSPILMACRDQQTGDLQSFCRVMSGFSDEVYQELTDFYSGRQLERPPAYVVTGEQCSIWFEPCEVFEIRGADITSSPVHKCAYESCADGRGLGLRFPRFIRKRPDKTVDEATASDEIAELFKSQAVRREA